VSSCVDVTDCTDKGDGDGPDYDEADGKTPRDGGPDFSLIGVHGAVSNVDTLCVKAPWLAWVCELPPAALGIIKGVLPPALLAVLFMLLPIFLRLLVRLQGEVRRKILALGNRSASMVGTALAVPPRLLRAEMRPDEKVMMRKPWMTWKSQNREKSLSSI
jgi:hypothetical protein